MHRLFERFGTEGVFGRGAVVELLALQNSSASKLIAKLVHAGMRTVIIDFLTADSVNCGE